MKSLFTLALLLLLCCTIGMGQTKKLSRTKKRPHGVDSVSSWQLRPDSAGLMKDSADVWRRTHN
jgi:hypothetical protein